MLPSGTRPSGLSLRTRDADALAGFYEEALGLEVVDREGPRAVLAPPGGGTELVLEEDPGAPVRPRRSVGMYHFALLVPDRRALGAVLGWLLEREAPLDGLADHGVSEAIYLHDPEGNGIEVYRDRDREAWPRHGDEVEMVTEPLDASDLRSTADGPAPLPEGTRLGHVHLHAGDLEQATALYQALGFRVTQSTYPGAMFLAAGGYHHHVGLNRWASTLAPEGATGLVQVDWALLAGRLPEAIERWTAEGLDVDRRGGSARVTDPMGIVNRFREGDGDPGPSDAQ